MKKSIYKDIEILLKIYNLQKDINKVLKDFNCRREAELYQNKYAMDLSALYIANIGELTKQLTDETKQCLRFFDVNKMRYFRNKIDHVYEKVNKQILSAYVFQVSDKKAMQEVSERIQVCNELKKAKVIVRDDMHLTNKLVAAKTIKKEPLSGTNRCSEKRKEREEKYGR